METDSSLNNSMDNAKKHYSSLFFLPSYNKAVLSSATLCIVGVSLAALVFFPAINSFALGISLFLATFISDFVISKTVLKHDPILNTRRTSAMSFYGWLLWLGFIALGTFLGFFFGWLLWVKLTLLGFGAVITLRIIVLTATSHEAAWRQLLAALLQPILCIVVFLLFLVTFSNTIVLQIFPFLLFSPIISYAATYLLFNSINRLGKKVYGLPAMPLFRAFILNWVTDANAPLEKYLEDLGENADIDVSLLKFDSSKPKAAIIVPLVHPGPFKNIGSSLLPSLLKDGFEKEYGCPACVPLGILGHELDLASQTQNQKIVAQVLSSAKLESDSPFASSLVRVNDGSAIASCQIFGDTALLSFTLAPKTTEDLPQELGRMVTEEARRLGLKHAVVINAHNCLDEVVDTNEHLDELKRAAIKCLQKATALTTAPFKVGAATVFPKEFSQKQGMGTGGITSVVIEVNKQKTVYITIDGNNMIPKLREKILTSLTSLGFDDSEIFTTDTHAVSAIVTGERGYHPIGEVMDHDILIRHIVEAAETAAANLEDSKARCIQFVVPQVRVIGEERLNSISSLVDKAIIKAKKVVAPIFGTEGLLLILLLMLF